MILSPQPIHTSSSSSSSLSSKHTHFIKKKNSTKKKKSPSSLIKKRSSFMIEKERVLYSLLLSKANSLSLTCMDSTTSYQLMYDLSVQMEKSISSALYDMNVMDDHLLSTSSSSSSKHIINSTNTTPSVSPSCSAIGIMIHTNPHHQNRKMSRDSSDMSSLTSSMDRRYPSSRRRRSSGQLSLLHQYHQRRCSNTTLNNTLGRKIDSSSEMQENLMIQSLMSANSEAFSPLLNALILEKETHSSSLSRKPAPTLRRGSNMMETPLSSLLDSPLSSHVGANSMSSWCASSSCSPAGFVPYHETIGRVAKKESISLESPGDFLLRTLERCANRTLSSSSSSSSGQDDPVVGEYESLFEELLMSSSSAAMNHASGWTLASPLDQYLQHTMAPTMTSSTTNTPASNTTTTTPTRTTTFVLSDQDIVNLHLQQSYLNDMHYILSTSSPLPLTVQTAITTTTTPSSPMTTTSLTTSTLQTHIQPTLHSLFHSHMTRLLSHTKHIQSSTSHLFQELQARLRARDEYLQNTIFDTAKRMTEMEQLISDLEMEREGFAGKLLAERSAYRQLEKVLVGCGLAEMIPKRARDFLDEEERESEMNEHSCGVKHFVERDEAEDGFVTSSSSSSRLFGVEQQEEDQVSVASEEDEIDSHGEEVHEEEERRGRRRRDSIHISDSLSKKRREGSRIVTLSRMSFREPTPSSSSRSQTPLRVKTSPLMRTVTCQTEQEEEVPEFEFKSVSVSVATIPLADTTHTACQTELPFSPTLPSPPEKKPTASASAATRLSSRSPSRTVSSSAVISLTKNVSSLMEENHSFQQDLVLARKQIEHLEAVARERDALINELLKKNKNASGRRGSVSSVTSSTTSPKLMPNKSLPAMKGTARRSSRDDGMASTVRASLAVPLTPLTSPESSSSGHSFPSSSVSSITKGSSSIPEARQEAKVQQPISPPQTPIRTTPTQSHTSSPPQSLQQHTSSPQAIPTTRIPSKAERILAAGDHISMMTTTPPSSPLPTSRSVRKAAGPAWSVPPVDTRRTTRLSLFPSTSSSSTSSSSKQPSPTSPQRTSHMWMGPSTSMLTTSSSTSSTGSLASLVAGNGLGISGMGSSGNHHGMSPMAAATATGKWIKSPFMKKSTSHGVLNGAQGTMASSSSSTVSNVSSSPPQMHARASPRMLGRKSMMTLMNPPMHSMGGLLEGTGCLPVSSHHAHPIMATRDDVHPASSLATQSDSLEPARKSTSSHVRRGSFQDMASFVLGGVVGGTGPSSTHTHGGSPHHPGYQRTRAQQELYEEQMRIHMIQQQHQQQHHH